MVASGLTTKLKHAGLEAWIASETLSGVACSAWLAGFYNNMKEQYYIEKCQSLRDGESASSEALGLTIHRWQDGWWALWHAPKTGNDLGRILKTEPMLQSFLNGNQNAGEVLTLRNAS